MAVKKDSYRLVVENLPDAFAYHQVVQDQEGKPEDYIFLEVNPAFEEMTGLAKKDIIGQRVTAVLPGIKDKGFDWVGAFGTVALTGKTTRIENYSEHLGNWYEVTAYSDQPGYFAVVFRDITDYKKVVKSLQDVETRLNRLLEEQQLLLDNIEVQIWYLTDLETYGAVNQAHARFFGVKKEDLEHKSLCTFLPEQEVKVCKESNIQVFTEKKPVRTEEYLVNSEGETRLLSITKTPRLDGGGNVEYVVCSAVDITEGKRAEEDLRESERRFDLAIAGTGAGLWDWDMVQDTVYYSPQWKAMLGYEQEEIENAFSGWKKLWHPDDAHKIQRALQDYLGGRTKKYEIEHRLKDKEGRWRWILTRGEIIKDGGGNPVRWVGTNIDLTDLKQMEEELLQSQQRLASVVQTQQEMVSRFLPDTTLTFVNEAYCRFFETPHQELVGKKFLELVPEAGHPAIMERISQLSADTPYQVYSHRVTLKDNSEAWHEWNDQAILDKDNNVVEIQSIGRDITERKQAEMELIRSNEELEMFAYAVSHDMRQPLRMINSYLQLLEQDLQGKLDEETRDYLGFALDGARRMDQMIRGLLDYSRVGRKAGPREQVDSREALEEALLFLEPATREAGASLHIGGEWPWLHASFDELSRLFQNLIGNSLKYRPRGNKPEIHLGVRQEGANWLFWVQDNGIGIEPSQVGRLFKVFSRLHPRTRYEGTGVGLALCRKIVEQHGGRIWVESEGPGKGSKFCFTLPRLTGGSKEDGS